MVIASWLNFPVVWSLSKCLNGSHVNKTLRIIHRLLGLQYQADSRLDESISSIAYTITRIFFCLSKIACFREWYSANTESGHIRDLFWTYLNGGFSFDSSRKRKFRSTVWQQDDLYVGKNQQIFVEEKSTIIWYNSDDFIK